MQHDPKLAKEVADGAARAFREAKQAHGDEEFFAFALSTLDNAPQAIMASVNSLENLERLRSKRGFEPRSIEEDEYKWNACDWGDLEYVGGAEPFSAAHKRADELLRGSSESEDEGTLEDENREYDESRRTILASMIEALAQLERDEFWGTGASRQRITVFATIYDSHETKEFEEASARSANPPEVFRAFQQRFARADAEEAEYQRAIADRETAVAHLDLEGQILYWIKELDYFVESDRDFQVRGYPPLKALAKLGPAVGPHLLGFVDQNLEREEFFVHSFIHEVLEELTKLTLTEESVKYAGALLLKAIELSEPRKLWQISPFHLAMLLYRQRPDSFPWPNMGSRNKLEEREVFREVIAGDTWFESPEESSGVPQAFGD